MKPYCYGKYLNEFKCCDCRHKKICLSKARGLDNKVKEENVELMNLLEKEITDYLKTHDIKDLSKLICKKIPKRMVYRIINKIEKSD